MPICSPKQSKIIRFFSNFNKKLSLIFRNLQSWAKAVIICNVRVVEDNLLSKNPPITCNSILQSSFTMIKISVKKSWKIQFEFLTYSIFLIKFNNWLIIKIKFSIIRNKCLDK